MDPREERLILGRPVKQWKNLWHYDKMKYVFITVLTLAAVSIAYTIITNTPPDFKLGGIGQIYVSDGSELQDFLHVAMPELKKITVDSAYISLTDTGTGDPIMYQKAMLMVTVSEEDVLALDRPQFTRLVSSGGFRSLDGLYPALLAALPASEQQKVVPMKAAVSQADGGDGIEHIYGIDVSALGTAQAIGLTGPQIVLTLSVDGKNLTNAETFLQKFLAATETLRATLTPTPTA